MSKITMWIMTTCCAAVLVTSVYGQSKQQPGLWEVTTQISMGGAMQMPQMPPGVNLPAALNPFAPKTSQLCVTQAMIDKYGAPYSNPPRSNCQVTDIQTKPDGMTATVKCTGNMDATGTVQSTFVDSTTTKTTMHIIGTMQQGSRNMPVDMTVQSTSVFKGADCGSVKPVAMPTGN
jgi:hypothetical protein